jgi:hypothetical protein
MCRIITLVTGILILLVNLTAKQAFAQNNQIKVGISGRVIDYNKNGIQLVNVKLINAVDSSTVKFMTSDENGHFNFTDIIPGNYFIKTSLLAFEDELSKLISVDKDHPEKIMVIIKLKEKVNMLATVNVEAKKQFIQHNLDKTTINVEGSAVSNGSTALEILARSPSITIDRDDNVAMEGKSNVLIMIDDKQTYMSQSDVVNLLRGMPSESIRSIELINRPSSRYDAAGTAGIINIKTKKDKRQGFNGTVGLGGGYGWTSKYNANTMVNYRKDNLNLFAGYDFMDNGRNGNGSMERSVNYMDRTTHFERQSKVFRRLGNQTYKFGADYTINSKNIIGILISGFNNRTKSPDNINNTNIVSSLPNEINELGWTNVNSNTKDRFRSNTVNLNYQYNIDSSGRKLSIDFDYSKYNGKTNDSRKVDTSFANKAGLYYVKNNARSSIDIKSFKSDYTHIFGKASSMNMGLKSSFVETDNNLEYLKSFNNDNNYIQNPEYTNRFVYKENINAAYASFASEISALSLQLGLRVEHTNADAELIEKSKKIYNYVDFFPSAALSYKINQVNNLAINYSRRIDRPNYDNLNPSLQELDNTTYKRGNEFLQPQYSNSLGLTHTFKDKYITTFSYSLTNDAITQITEQDDQSGRTYLIDRNISQLKSFSLNIFAPFKLTGFWSISNNLNIFNNKYEYTYKDVMYRNSQTSFNYNLSNDITIKKGVTFESIFMYQSPLTYGTYRIKSSSSLDFGIRALLNEKYNVRLSISDVFKGRKLDGSTNYGGINLHFNEYVESRIVRLSVSYRFGSNKIQNVRQRKTGSEDEVKRVKK